MTHEPARAAAFRAGPDSRADGPFCGSQSTLEDLYRQERGSLMRYLRAQEDAATAADIVQEVFLRAAAREMCELTNPGAYLRKIARNIILDKARRRNCRIKTVPLSETCDAPCPALQEHSLEAQRLAAALDRALIELPERTRRIFAMHRFEGKPYRQIQGELGLTPAGVEYHMMKALAHVRIALSPFR